ncbi:alpha/beta fold hydrolase [Vreelandella nanhaiensis]|uniref:Alpha/beta fold hydrolase n=1 Tax=Vreelandella nanhaiensis TaxID=1258546 RepID=A0A433KY12_9GAMM|nr:alpha/beta fold hydrolase [Halomonas nanhaiensis]RUR34551.1 alpha/beta fold hydrolase [Halomonas nanhaiensis]
MTRLVLLSGWGIDQRIWQPIQPYWPDNVNAVTVDWPGYGKAPALPANASIDELATVMAGRLPSDSVWVGWSLGGLLATALLDYFPAPRGLVLLGAGTRFCVPGSALAAELDDFRAVFARRPDAAWRHFLRWQAQGEPAPQQAYTQLRDLLGKTPGADHATLATGLHWLATLDNRQRLKVPPCPVVHLAGEHDPLISRTTRQEALPIARCGHCPMLSQPARLASLLAAQAAMLSAEEIV